jgi:hypothetical protein
MASGKTLNAANLQALGAERLAELLIEISAGDAATKRRLRLALAGTAGSATVAHEVSKRLASIAKARSFIDWQKIKPLAADLEAQRAAIRDFIAPTDPREAFELTWRLVGCAESVLSRSDDGSGRLGAIFHDAAADLGKLAQAAELEPLDLAERAFTALRADSQGAWEKLVPILAPQLGAPGLAALKQRMKEWQAEPVTVPPARERQVIGWSSAGPIHADELQTSHRRHVAAFTLQQIANALGDVDSYVAQIDAKARKAPLIAAEIARRMLDAGRPKDAWKALEAADTSQRNWTPMEWEQARADTLEALGRFDDAQEFRWQRFEATLNTTHLRAFLAKLPDFEDFDAEQRALALALTHPNFHQALAFLVTWPDLQRANQLVLARPKELNGDLYDLLSPAADALDTKYPLAAILLRRAMIDFSLQNARASRYKHAARHLSECASLARRVPDFGEVPDHTAYERALRAAHARKAGFWQEVKATA